MGDFKVLVTRAIPKPGMDLIENECKVVWAKDASIPKDELIKMIKGVDGIVCTLSDPLGKDVMDAAGENLKAISTMAVGYDNIDIDEATNRNIYVGHTPGVLTESTADLTWALILSLSRRIVEGDNMMREEKFDGWAPLMLIGGDFVDRTIGIVGMGRIGQAVARRARGFNMKVIYHNRNRLDKSIEDKLNATYVSIDELTEKSDYISLHCPLNDESKHLFDEKRIDRMKPSAYIINVGRGPIVDESALVKALHNKKIAGAAFDVYENEPELADGLIDLPNVVLAPHIGSASKKTRNKMAIMTAQNLIRGMKRKVPEWCVNPEVGKK
jgi:glyoxylate reductase